MSESKREGDVCDSGERLSDSYLCDSDTKQ